MTIGGSVVFLQCGSWPSIAVFLSSMIVLLDVIDFIAKVMLPRLVHFLDYLSNENPLSNHGDADGADGKERLMQATDGSKKGQNIANLALVSVLRLFQPNEDRGNISISLVEVVLVDLDVCNGWECFIGLPPKPYVVLECNDGLLDEEVRSLADRHIQL
jgi:hypothetical protein